MRDTTVVLSWVVINLSSRVPSMEKAGNANIGCLNCGKKVEKRGGRLDTRCGPVKEEEEQSLNGSTIKYGHRQSDENLAKSMTPTLIGKQ
eukprot:scaffold30979_cov86-Cyclotella_meneghiniana.AAC.2